MLEQGILEDDIFVGRKLNKLVGKIMYISTDGKFHRYYPDIYIKSLNKIIEIKCDYTYNVVLEINLIKAETTRKLGFNFEFMIINL